MPISVTTPIKRKVAGPTTGRADLWSYNYTGVNGVGHVAPGSAGDWAVGVRSVASNRAIMSRKQFMGYSGIDLWNLSSEERFKLAKSLSDAPNEKDLRDIANALGFTSLNKKGGWEIWHHAPRYLYEKDMMQGQSVLLGYGTISFSSASGIMIDPQWLWDGFGGQYGERQVSEGNIDRLQPSIDRVGDFGGFLVSMVETPFVIRSGELGMLDKMKNIPYSQVKRVLNQYTKGAVRGLRTTSRALGVAGLVVGAGISTFNLSTGNGQLSDLTDLAVLGVGAIIIGAAGTAAAPFVAAGGLIYGGVMLFGGEDYINNSAFGQAVRGYLDF